MDRDDSGLLRPTAAIIPGLPTDLLRPTAGTTTGLYIQPLVPLLDYLAVNDNETNRL